jgi:hypothetical protein
VQDLIRSRYQDQSTRENSILWEHLGFSFMMAIGCPQHYNWSFAPHQTTHHVGIMYSSSPGQGKSVVFMGQISLVRYGKYRHQFHLHLRSFLASNFLFDLLGQEFGIQWCKGKIMIRGHQQVYGIWYSDFIYLQVSSDNSWYLVDAVMATGSLWVLAVNGAERALPSNALSSSASLSFVLSNTYQMVCPPIQVDASFSQH